MRLNFAVMLLAILCFMLAPFSISQATALGIANPDEIEVVGLVSLGEDGAAWLRWGGREFLVTPGYIIGRDLRVVSIRHDSVVLYRNEQKKYFALSPKTYDLPAKDRTHVIWCSPMPLWKAIRMIGLAYRKDYICHSETRAELSTKRHCPDMLNMLKLAVNPHHRAHGRNGILYVSPVHIFGTDWKWFNEQVRVFQSRNLVKWFPVLSDKGTVISDGRDLSSVLEFISWRVRVPIIWDHPIKMPLYCSFKDRPWYEIIENIVLFNGLGLQPTKNKLTLTKGSR